ncbi:MAG: mechanosensitive ion channel protein MscS [Muricauda sp.]|jgi:small-conductance mechanosensitive channel|nr:mechanosensitive ion channel family protein [Allomuricauda sp.]MAU15966.1 mechanosensitive ion channel protein MscS [Allomuricauda sp.]|tara:strand:- start:2778 stop:3830 length:1053 start_codon:yes stop_codon:yes gene_type:complete
MKTQFLDILKNQYGSVAIAIALGFLFGQLVLRALFKKLGSFSDRTKLSYSSVLFKSLGKISFLLGIFLAVNLLQILPFDISFDDWFKKMKISLNVFILTYLLAELLVYFYDSYTKSKSGKGTSLYHIIIRILAYITGLVVFTNLIGFELAPVLTALGVGGLAVALALQDTLGNLFAGLHILAAKQLKPGDYIKLDSGEEGYVVDINWRNTEVKTLLENVIIVPNSKISSSISTNYFTLQKNMFFQVTVGVHYDSDLEHVEKVTLETAKELLAEYAPDLKNFEPKVRFFEFGDSSINMKVWLATDLYENQFEMRHEFVKRLHRQFNKEGIVIPFPIRTLHLPDSLKIESNQ